MENQCWTWQEETQGDELEAIPARSNLDEAGTVDVSTQRHSERHLKDISLNNNFFFFNFKNHEIRGAEMNTFLILEHVSLLYKF